MAGPENRNAFTLFGLQPRPHLDSAALEQKFAELSQRVQPTEQAEIARAHRHLKDPSQRLRLLCELENWIEATPSQIPCLTTELYAPVRRALARADACLTRTEGAPGPEVAAALADCAAASARVQESVDELNAAVVELDAGWPENKEEAKPRLIGLIGAYAYQTKWLHQLQERMAKLKSLS